MPLTIRSIGKTDIKVTTLGFGGAPLGGAGDRITEAQVEAVVETAWDGGIRYFDTAPLYGHGLSEKRLGAHLGNLSRDEFALSSKVGRLLVPLAEGIRNPLMRDSEPFGIRYDYSYAATRRSLESSLERLHLDRVDILLCHDIDRWTHGDDASQIFETAARGVLPALADLRSEGVIRAFGLGVNEAAVCSRVMDHFDVDCFLLAGRFTLLEQSPLDDLLPKCLENQVSVIIGGPYNSGLLAATERKRATYDYRPVDDARWARAQHIRAVCEVHGVDPRAAALQYPLRHPAVASVIPGVWTVEEVKTNLMLIKSDIPDVLWDDLAEAGLARKF
ncbi:MAG: aldo/keto reductase [Gammaproteobacteria bacterium]|nr:aldo/keto reductase [Gammaproteobacteria bacterium]